MKYRGHYIATTILFLLVNTAYFWEGRLKGWDILIMIFISIFLLSLVVVLLKQLFFAVKEKGKDRQRLYLIFMMAVLLTLCAYRPTGAIDFEYFFEGNDKLVAFREGAANCTTTLKLKDTGKFNFHQICFINEKTTGTYTIARDTIILSFNGHSNQVKYAVFVQDSGYPEKVHRHTKDIQP